MKDTHVNGLFGAAKVDPLVFQRCIRLQHSAPLTEFNQDLVRRCPGEAIETMPSWPEPVGNEFVSKLVPGGHCQLYQNPFYPGISAAGVVKEKIALTINCQAVLVLFKGT
jgi:hypothetical protein